MSDPKEWEPLPGEWTEWCSVATASARETRFPVLEWSGCGQGCEKANILHGFTEYAGYVSLGRVRVGEKDALFGSFFQPLFPAGPSEKVVGINRVIELDTGATISIAKLEYAYSGQATCWILDTPESPVYVRFAYRMPDESGSRYAAGTLEPISRTYKWQQPWIEATPEFYCPAITLAGGTRLYLCGKRVRAQQPESSEILDLQVLNEWSSSAATPWGNGAIWAELQVSGAGSRVRHWAPGTEVTTIMSSVPGDTCALATDGRSIAGILVDMERSGLCSVMQPNARFWRASLDDGTGFEEGPVLHDGTVGVRQTGSMSVSGDFVVAIVNVSETPMARNRMVVARVSDWALRWFDPPEGEFFASQALSLEYLYYATAKSGAENGRFSEIFRLDLRKYFDEREPTR